MTQAQPPNDFEDLVAKTQRLLLVIELYWQRSQYEQACIREDRPLPITIRWEMLHSALLELDSLGFRSRFRQLTRVCRSRTKRAIAIWSPFSLETTDGGTAMPRRKKRSGSTGQRWVRHKETGDIARVVTAFDGQLWVIPGIYGQTQEVWKESECEDTNPPNA